MQEPILTVTINPAVDVNTAVDVVEPEHKLRCDAPEREAGGGGVNVARAITELGGSVRAVVAASGKGGALLTDLLAAEGVDPIAVATSGETRQSVNVFERSTGREFRFVMPAPELTSHDVQRVLAAVAAAEPRPSYIAGSGSVPAGCPDFYRQLGDLAASLGARLIVDSSGEALRHAIGGGAFLIKPNLKEFCSIIGREVSRENDIINAARELLAKGRVSALVISRASAGAVVVSNDIAAAVVPPHVESASQVGAGDSMVAATTLALARGNSLVEAVRYGVAAGTAAVLTSGAELCRHADVEALLPQVQVTAIP